MCGGPGMDLKVCSTLAFEHAHNDALRIDDEDEFVAQALAGLGPQPPNFNNIVALNKGPLVYDSVNANPLAPRQVERHRADGALLVDVRTELQFDDAHIPGAVSNTMLRAGFGSKLAWIADSDEPVVFIGRDDDDGRRAADLAAAVGITRIARLPPRRHDRMARRETRGPGDRADHRRGTSRALGGAAKFRCSTCARTASGTPAHIPGSVHVPYHDLDALPDDLDPDRPVAVMCASGQRAAVGASLAQRFGAREVLHVVEGGVPKWKRQGFPVEQPSDDRTGSTQAA